MMLASLLFQQNERRMTTLFQEVSRFLQSAAQQSMQVLLKGGGGFEFIGESSSSTTVVTDVQRRDDNGPNNMDKIRKDSYSKNNSTSPTNMSSSSLSFWWMLSSSLLCGGVSTALIYSLWIDYRQQQQRSKSRDHRNHHHHRVAPSTFNDTRHDDFPPHYYSYYIQSVQNFILTQGRNVAQKIWEHFQEYQPEWMDFFTHVCMGSFMWGIFFLDSSSSNSTSSRNFRSAAAAAAAATSLMLGGGSLAGLLWIRRCVSYPLNKSSGDDDDDDSNNDNESYNYPSLHQSITPYLFLYAACPPTQRVRLWLAWMILRWADLIASSSSSSSKRRTRTIQPPGNGAKRFSNDTKNWSSSIHHKEPLQHQTSGSGMGSSSSTERAAAERAAAALPLCDNASVGSSTAPISPPDRYLELLVHNVSHTDFVLSLDIPTKIGNNNNDSNSSSHDNDVDKYCLCRPRFSFFDTYCRMALESLSSGNNNDHNDNDNDAKIVSFPRYKRALDDLRRYVMQEEATLIPTGFELKPDPHHLVASLSEVRIRGIDQAKVAEALQEQKRQHHEEKEDADIDKEEEDDGTVLLASGAEQQSLTSSHSWTTSKTKSSFPIGHVFFPLLATLLPHWQSQIAEKELLPQRAIVKRVLVLVTGVGTPRNFTHSLRGNSTQACAVLMERFLHRIDPGLTVVRIHSETNIFRYDDNLLFVERELMPVLNSYRDTHALGLPYPDEVKNDDEITSTTRMTTTAMQQPLQPFNADWRKSMSVYVSFADGSPARTYAIQASMRPFRPTFFHFWQLKTFWHESKIVDDDLEVHSFEAMETSPPVDTDRLRGDPQLQAVVAEMKSFRDDMVKALQSGQHDIEKFWLRKTFKPVLAVLLVHSADMKEPILYRGTNMEVSMPTGSLCAERNVIGTALSANPRLKREDLKMIAVLAVPYTPTIPDNIAGGAGMKRINSTASFTSAGGGRRISIGSEQEEWVATSSSSQLPPPAPPLLSSQRQSREDLASSFAMVGLNDVIIDSSGEHGQSTAAAAAVEAGNRQQQQPDNSLSSAPVRKIALFSKSTSLPDSMSARSDPNSHIDNSNKGGKKKSSSSSSQQQQHGRHDEQQQQHRVHLDNHRHQYRQQYDKRTVVVHNPSTDMNPLAPCGACNEWLKKIAESNPYFRIVTFTDADCNGVYCTNCQE